MTHMWIHAFLMCGRTSEKLVLYVLTCCRPTRPSASGGRPGDPRSPSFTRPTTGAALALRLVELKPNHWMTDAGECC